MSSSATAPIISTQPPPSYTQSQSTNSPVVNQPLGAPPPYSPPTYVLESRGQGYQRFDVIEGPVTLVSLSSLSKDPCLVVCPSCGKQVVTVTRPVPGALTCLVAALCLFVFCPCVVLPFCIAELMDVAHNCPICNTYLGTYSRI